MTKKELNQQDLQRYARHIGLKSFGVNGQLKMNQSRVLVVGVGGLGSVTSSLLTRAGIGYLGLIDHDAVRLSDLGRQILYETPDIGRQKILVAQERLREINPEVAIQIYDEALGEENAAQIIQEYELIMDGTDNLKARQLINRVCVKQGKPFVHGAVDGFDGQVGVFWKGHGACYACLHPLGETGIAPDREDVINVLNSLVFLVGSLQANEAIKWITGIGSPLISQLLILNALDMRFHKATVPKRDDCEICS
ncbi:MAG: HesA/MoeB/ThiF family protein [Chloroflexota bacterium]|jgi:adenylyltransferase/sulfurtransferase|nr:HesA/MoeB/ThiF family protein [Chloroflexota bacterium]